MIDGKSCLMSYRQWTDGICADLHSFLKLLLKYPDHLGNKLAKKM